MRTEAQYGVERLILLRRRRWTLDVDVGRWALSVERFLRIHCRAACDTLRDVFTTARDILSKERLIECPV
jgi:hypothetical protein